MKKIKNLIFCVVIILGVSNLIFAASTNEIDTAIAKYAAKYNVDEALVKAVIQIESGGSQSARSPVGAIGLMQLMPDTARTLGVNAYSIDGNINGGTKLIRMMLDRYNGNLEFALAAYNAGPGNVDKYGGVPPFTETKNYVKLVMQLYKQLKGDSSTISSNTTTTTTNNKVSTYAWPTTSKLIKSQTGKFGMRIHPIYGTYKMHNGIDLSVSYQPCYAIADGTITYVNSVDSYGGGAGYYVVLHIGDNTVARYLHLSKIHVKVGEKVKKGQVIATSGNTGASTGPHLHFEVRLNANINTGLGGTPVDPEKFLVGTNTYSGSTSQRKCDKCGGVISDEYYETIDGKHYRKCTANEKHQYDIGEHKFKDGKCTVCKVSAKEVLFVDFPANHWAYNEVKIMKDVGIVYGNNGFLEPNKSITAEEFITLLAQVLDKKKVAKVDGEVYLNNEMRVNTWSHNTYVNLAKSLGNKGDNTKKLGEKEIKLILGDTDEEVIKNYKKPITREKVVALMANFVNVDDKSVTSNNTILKAKDWDKINPIYRERINKLAKKEIFKGAENTDGTISVNPTKEVTKVEAIVLLCRLYNVL